MGTLNGNKNDAATNRRAGESTPLLMNPSNASGDSAVGNGSNHNNNGGSNNSNSHPYYFVNGATGDGPGGSNSLVRDEDAGQVVDEIPEGSHTDEFAPKVLAPPMGTGHNSAASPAPGRRHGSKSRSSAGNEGFWANLFGGRGGQSHHHQPAPTTRTSHPHIAGGDIGTLVKPRKAPIKIEPKVFFANERTFLAWMHLSVTLAGASIAILAFAEDQNPFSQLYGVLLLPVAIAFIIYSMYQYARRSTMIRLRHPGPYEDTVGPAFLGIMLMVSIVAQFALKLYAMASV